jgi:hypothetical protein
MVGDAAGETMVAMNHASAEDPGSHAGAPDSLDALEEALQVLSAAWYELAADGSPGIVERRRGRGSEAPSWRRFDRIPGEQEVRRPGDEFPRFHRHRRPTGRAA